MCYRRICTHSHILTQVFLHPVPPSATVWDEVAPYPQVYVVLGSPLETRDLVRAGVLSLSRVIILSSGIASGGSSDDGYLTDADALFTYQSIAKVRPGVPIVCEIDSGKNVSFLCGDATSADTPEQNTTSAVGSKGMTDNSFTMLAPFAAGAVYVDSLQDKLAVQAFYNGNLLRIIRELVIGQVSGAGDIHINSECRH